MHARDDSDSRRRACIAYANQINYYGYVGAEVRRGEKGELTNPSTNPHFDKAFGPRDRESATVTDDRNTDRREE